MRYPKYPEYGNAWEEQRGWYQRWYKKLHGRNWVKDYENDTKYRGEYKRKHADTADDESEDYVYNYKIEEYNRAYGDGYSVGYSSGYKGTQRVEFYKEYEHNYIGYIDGYNDGYDDGHDDVLNNREAQHEDPYAKNDNKYFIDECGMLCGEDPDDWDETSYPPRPEYVAAYNDGYNRAYKLGYDDGYHSSFPFRRPDRNICKDEEYNYPEIDEENDKESYEGYRIGKFLGYSEGRRKGEKVRYNEKHKNDWTILHIIKYLCGMVLLCVLLIYLMMNMGQIVIDLITSLGK